MAAVILRKILVAATLVSLLFFMAAVAGAEAVPSDDTPPFESDYFICQTLRSNLVKPNCPTWCHSMGFQTGHVHTGDCCCTNGR